MIKRLTAFTPELKPDQLMRACMRKGRWGNLAVVSSDWLPDSIITVHTSEMKHLKSLASFIETPDLKPGFPGQPLLWVSSEAQLLCRQTKQ